MKARHTLQPAKSATWKKKQNTSFKINQPSNTFCYKVNSILQSKKYASIKTTCSITNNLTRLAQLQASKSNQELISHLSTQTLDLISHGEFNKLNTLIKNPEICLRSRTQIQSKMREFKRIGNEIANQLFTTDDDFRNARIEYIQHALKKSSALIQFEEADARMQYRFIMPHSQNTDIAYGTPEYVFTNGLAPSTFRISSFHPEGTTHIEKPYIMDAIKHDCIRTGWTFGSVSITSNLLYAAEAKFVSKEYQARGFLYAIVDHGQSASAANCLHREIKSNSLLAEENLKTHIRPNDVFAAREIDENGRINEIIRNPNCRQSFQTDAKFYKFLEANSVAELQAVALLRDISMNKFPHLHEENKIKENFQQIGKEKISFYWRNIHLKNNHSVFFQNRVANNKAELMEKNAAIINKKC